MNNGIYHPTYIGRAVRNAGKFFVHVMTYNFFLNRFLNVSCSAVATKFHSGINNFKNFNVKISLFEHLFILSAKTKNNATKYWWHCS